VHFFQNILGHAVTSDHIGILNKESMRMCEGNIRAEKICNVPKSRNFSSAAFHSRVYELHHLKMLIISCQSNEQFRANPNLYAKCFLCVLRADW